MSNSDPSRDPANEGDLLGAFNTVLDKFLQGIDDCLPARVIAYDRATNRATVQPLIQMVNTNRQRISRAHVASVPVYQIGGGGFLLSFPIEPGDLGWLKANDRDISLFLQSGTESGPNTYRKHSFSDAVFFPDLIRNYTIAGEDMGRVVLQTRDGSAKIALGTDSIKLQAGGQTLELSSAGFRHNGVNVGSTHVHGGVETGGANTDGPS